MKLSKIIMIVLVIISIAIIIVTVQFDFYSLQRAILITVANSILIATACITIINPNFFGQRNAITTRLLGILVIALGIYLVYGAWNIYWSQ